MLHDINVVFGYYFIFLLNDRSLEYLELILFVFLEKKKEKSPKETKKRDKRKGISYGKRSKKKIGS